MITDQGTVRVDRVFDARRYDQRPLLGQRRTRIHAAESARLSGSITTTCGQNGAVIWTHVISPNLVNTASASVSRLAMFHYTENNGVNDIVGALGITGVELRRTKGRGALRISTCKGILRWAIPGSLRRCTCGTQFWRDAIR